MKDVQIKIYEITEIEYCKCVTVEINPEDGLYVAFLSNNPEKRYTAFSEEAAIGRLVLALAGKSKRRRY